MICHIKAHPHATPGADGRFGDILTLFPKTRAQTTDSWILARMQSTAMLSDLVEFLENKWFRQRVGKKVAITCLKVGTTSTFFDRTTTVDDLFSRESVLKLGTDTTYRVHVEYIARITCHMADSPVSIVAETCIIPSLQFEVLNGKTQRTVRNISIAPCRAEDDSDARSAGRNGGSI